MGDHAGRDDGPVPALDARETERLVEVLLGGDRRRRRQGTGRRVVRGQPAVRRRSWSRCSSTRASSAYDDDVAADGRPARPRPCRPRSRRCSPPASTTSRARSGRSWSRPPSSACRSPRRRSRSSCPGRFGRRAAHLGSARPQAVRRPRRRDDDERGRDPYRFRNLHDQGRHLRVAAQARPGAAPRAVRDLGGARQPGARPRAGVRGDPRLPPRAGLPLPDRARAARRRGQGDRRARRHEALERRPARVGPRRHAGLRVAAQAGGRAPADVIRRPARDPVRPRRGARPARAARRGAHADQGGRAPRRSSSATSASWHGWRSTSSMLEQFAGTGSAAQQIERAQGDHRDAASATRTTSRWLARGTRSSSAS